MKKRKLHDVPTFRNGLEEKKLRKKVAIEVGGRSAECGVIGAKRKFSVEWGRSTVSNVTKGREAVGRERTVDGVTPIAADIQYLRLLS